MTQFLIFFSFFFLEILHSFESCFPFLFSRFLLKFAHLKWDEWVKADEVSLHFGGKMWFTYGDFSAQGQSRKLPPVELIKEFVNRFQGEQDWRLMRFGINFWVNKYYWQVTFHNVYSFMCFLIWSNLTNQRLYLKSSFLLYILPLFIIIPVVIVCTVPL